MRIDDVSFHGLLDWYVYRYLEFCISAINKCCFMALLCYYERMEQGRDPGMRQLRVPQLSPLTSSILHYSIFN